MTEPTDPTTDGPGTAGAGERPADAASGGGYRSVSLTRTGAGRFEAVNDRGGRVSMGTGEDAELTPVELLLAAIAGCSAVDVDLLTARRAEPTRFEAVASGEKIRDEDGNHMRDLEVCFTVRFPDGAEGDAAREMLPRAITMSHERLCTVSRTVALPTPVRMRQD